MAKPSTTERDLATFSRAAAKAVRAMRKAGDHAGAARALAAAQDAVARMRQEAGLTGGGWGAVA